MSLCNGLRRVRNSRGWIGRDVHFWFCSNSFVRIILRDCSDELRLCHRRRCRRHWRFSFCGMPGHPHQRNTTGEKSAEKNSSHPSRQGVSPSAKGACALQRIAKSREDALHPRWHLVIRKGIAHGSRPPKGAAFGISRALRHSPAYASSDE